MDGPKVKRKRRQTGRLGATRFRGEISPARREISLFKARCGQGNGVVRGRTTYEEHGYRYPPLKRWAIVVRPCGADVTDGTDRGRLTKPGGRQKIAQRFIAGKPELRVK